MDKYQILKNIFISHSNSEYAQSMSDYMRNLFTFYGIPSPVRKKLYSDLIKKEKKDKEIDWEFLDKCYADEHREFQYFVVDYLCSFKKILSYDDINKITNYVSQKQWWDTIDFFDKIIGDIGLTDYRVNDLMLKWSKDSNIWLRRIAIDHQNGRKEKTNTSLLEAILVNNLGSNEFFINKAIGWSLREYSKTNLLWVKDFINKYKDKMSKLSIKEANKYI